MIPAALTHNWHLKLLALVIAFGLWLFVVVGERTQMAVAAPIEYVGLPADLVLVGGARERVDLGLEAARWVAARVTADAVRVRVSLAHLRDGESILALSPADVQAPAGVTITRITPPRIRVTAARAVEATLRVVPQVRGTPAPGYAVARVGVEPSAVQVKGPRSTIEARRTVETAPVDIGGGRATVTQTVGLVLPEYAYPTRDGSVQVSVEIRPEGRGPLEGARK